MMEDLIKRKGAYGISVGLGPDQYITIAGPNKK